MEKFIEVIALDEKDIEELNKIDIDRIELVRNIKVGGLTPDLKVVKECVLKSKHKIRIMLRFTPDFEIENLDHYKEYILELKKIKNQNLDGIVLGFLKHNKLAYDECN